MSTRNFLIATIVASAAVANAKAFPGSLDTKLFARQSIPDSCTRVTEVVGSCIPADATESDVLGPTVANCICRAGDFDGDLVNCITEAGSLLPADYEQALEAFRGYCATYGNGGGSNPDPTPTRGGGGNTPTPTSGSGTGSEYCDYFISGIEQCWTDQNPLPTAPPVAKCLCQGGQFDTAVEGCYSDLVNANPEGASTVAAFGGFCSSYSAGAFDTPETTRGGSSPTRTPSDDNDVPSNTRVIETSRPTTDRNNDNNNNNNNNNNDDEDDERNPNAAGSLKVAALGTSLVALLAGAALFL